MSQSINTNLPSLDAQRSSTRTQGELAAAIGRLSSGLRINSARDDAAGLAIADRFTAQIRGSAQAGRNANDAISLAQTADGALASVGDNLQRIRELAVQAANATNSASDRASLQLEVAQLVAEVDRVATQTQFNGTNLLDGSFAAKAFQVGADAGQTVTVPALASIRSSSLGVYQGAILDNATIGNATPVNVQRALSVTVGGGPTIALGNITIDATALAAAINAAHVPGLTVTALPMNGAFTNATPSAGASASGTGVLTLNGVAINLVGNPGVAALAGNVAAAVAAINAQAALSGVTALDTGDGIALASPDGRNIAMSYSAGTFTGSSSYDFGIWNHDWRSQVSISYVAPPGTSGNVVIAQTGGLNRTLAIGAVGTPLSAIDVSTAAGASGALASIDRALATVDADRASLGAVQSRFESTVETLQAAGQNVTAARSRIQDADFAQETANLSRSQVLQQAGTAMVAQANQLPRQVLSLLR